MRLHLTVSAAEAIRRGQNIAGAATLEVDMSELAADELALLSRHAITVATGGAVFPGEVGAPTLAALLQELARREESAP